MFHIAWKSFKYNIKCFVVFFLSAVFSVAMIFGFMYLSELTKGVKVAGIDSTSGLLLGQTVGVSFFTSICIMVYSVKFYIRTRAKDGYSEKTFHLICGTGVSVQLDFIYRNRSGCGKSPGKRV